MRGMCVQLVLWNVHVYLHSSCACVCVCASDKEVSVARRPGKQAVSVVVGGFLFHLAMGSVYSWGA